MSERTLLYRIQLSRRLLRGIGWTKHCTLVKIVRGGREVGRAYSDHRDDPDETVRRAKIAARKEVKFLRSLGKTSETAHV